MGIVMMKRRTFDHLLWLRAQRRQRSAAVIVIITRRSQIMDTLQRLRQYSKHCQHQENRHLSLL